MASAIRSFVDRCRTEILGGAANLADVLDAVVARAERISAGTAVDDPFDGPEIEELSRLRDGILTAWAREPGSTGPEVLRALNRAVDHAMETAVARRCDARVALHERALAKLEALLAASPVGMAFVDRDLRYLRINDALARLNGRPAEEHLGRTIAEVLPDAAPVIEPLVRGILETGRPLMNYELTRPDGFSVLANYFPIRDVGGEIAAVGAVVLDVTDQKRARDALRAEQARLQSILDHAPNAIWVKDADGRVLVANQRLAEALGHSLEALVGSRSRDVLPAEVASQHEAHDAEVLREHRSIDVEETVPSPGGPRTFLSTKFPIPGDPPLVGAIATEITERKRMEHELRIAVKTREDVLAVVSHDLRSPLQTVHLAVSMLQGQLPTDHRTRRYLEMIHRASLRMDTLIDDLLDTANIRAGRLVLETKREPLDAVVIEAVDLQEPLAAEKGISLVRAASVEGIDVTCDRDRILQVFGNLIGNAIKFCRSGDVITIGAEPAGDLVRLSVANTGPAIAPDVLPYLFDPYWSGTEHASQGSGLGLFICRGIVEGHGGTIWAESLPGETGVRFLFTLPIARP